MKKVSVQFVNFWKNFNPQCYAFLGLFQKQYHQQIVDLDPDILFFADRTNKRKIDKQQAKNSVCVSYTGENIKPNSSAVDFSFSYDDTTETNFQIPDFATLQYYFDFIQQTEPNKLQCLPKNKFCNFIYHNPKPQGRQRFCNQLQRYKSVDCPGRVLNNMANFTPTGRHATDWWGDKIKHLGQYKFTIAFENECATNYITEKIFDPFYVGSIPIYLGAPNITEFFDPGSFINVQDFRSFDEAIAFVKEIDNNDELYQTMRSTPPIHNSSKLKACTEENILKRFEIIIDTINKKQRP